MASALPSQQKHENDTVSNVRRAFRDYTAALFYASRQAGNNVGEYKSADERITITDPLQEAAAVIVKRKQSLRNNATLLEGTLRGNVKESEALHCCLKSQPCVGGRKGLCSMINTRD
jgi:hypothetical protein